MILSPTVPPRYSPSSEFRRDLEARVAGYFEASQRCRQGSGRMYVKTAILMAWLVGSYVGLVWGATAWWQAVPLAMSLALAMAGVGFNVQHDGNHGAYSRHCAVNKVAALTLNLLGGDAYFWHFKHNIAHHTYPNVTGSDDDIRLGPLARLSPHQRRYWFHRFQHLYVWGLYALLALNWQISGDFRSMLKPGVGDTPVSRPRGWDLLCFCIGKASFLTLALVIPLLHHRVVTVVGCLPPHRRDPGVGAGDRLSARPLRRGGGLPRSRRPRRRASIASGWFTSWRPRSTSRATTGF